MKKIIIIIILLFLVTGCYDYSELNDLAFISAIGIDYENENFNLTYEILNDSKDKEENENSYIVSSNGKTISKAIDNISLKISKIPYYYHLKIVIISKDVAENHMDEITDFLIRDPKILNAFYLVVSKDSTSKEILSLKDEHKSVVSDIINDMLESNKEEFNTIYNGMFEDFLEDYLNEYKEASLTAISIKENTISVDGQALFKGNKLTLCLNNEKSALLNMLKNEKANTTLETKDMSVKLSLCKTKYNVKKEYSNISVTCDGQITDNTKYHLKNEKEYQKLNEEFSSILKEKMEDLIELLKDNKIDAFNLRYHQYQKYKKNTKPKIKEISSKVSINKKGLIFGVNNE